jgi:HAD superfamily hydrolase (TIGR01490 family)
MREVIAPAIRPKAVELLQRHLDAGDLVAIITATNGWLTAPIARALNVEHLIAARPELDQRGHPTGKLLGTPTQGHGKVTHMHAWLEGLGRPFGAFERSYFYSDSHNDIPLLSVVSHPVATNPSTRLAQHASAHGWPLLHLFND